jgi:hypothetical protein
MSNWQRRKKYPSLSLAYFLNYLGSQILAKKSTSLSYEKYEGTKFVSCVSDIQFDFSSKNNMEVIKATMNHYFSNLKYRLLYDYWEKKEGTTTYFDRTKKINRLFNKRR